MIRVLTMAAVLSLAVVSGSMAEEYSWSLSGSSTDPNANTGPATAPGESFQVYLWLNCTTFDGMAGVEFSLQSGFFNAGFTPMGGALNARDSVDVWLAVGGCPLAPYLIGAWTFQDFTGLGGFACLGPSPGGVNGTVDCTPGNPLIHANAVAGFTTDGLAPCVVGICEGPVSVTPSTWGRLKALYRDGRGGAQ